MTSQEVRDAFCRLLALKTVPVGVKWCKTAEDWKSYQVPSAKLSFCQAVKGAAHLGWSLACPADQMGCFTAQMIFGFRPPSERDIEHHQKQFTANPDIARRMVENKPKFAPGEVAGILTGPLGSAFEPDVVIFIVDSLQAMGLIESYTYSKGETLRFANGVSSAICSYGAVVAEQTREPNLAIPCVGAKRYGTFQDHEMAFCVPFTAAAEMASSALAMERAKQFPIPIGTAFLSPTIPMNYILKQ